MLDVGSELANGDSSINLNITPLIDVVFLLLIFFLLASAFARPTFDVALPDATHSRLEPEPKRQIFVFLTRDGRVLVDSLRTTAFASIKNLTDETYIKDRTRGIQGGMPFLIHGGLKYAW